MNTPKIPIYFVPGMAAGPEIFRNLQLDESLFDVNILEWIIPEKGESVSHYAKRLAKGVDKKNVVLIGVSFGGVIAQEMATFLSIRKLIIISSVKSRYELPKRLKVARRTRLYKLIPTRLVLSSNDLTKFSVGPRSKKRLRLYQEFLHVRDKKYLDWAIKNMVCWKRQIPEENVVHIHGDCDIVFPIQNISNCIVIKGGTHIMLLNRATDVSKKIEEVITQ